MATVDRSICKNGSYSVVKLTRREIEVLRTAVVINPQRVIVVADNSSPEARGLL